MKPATKFTVDTGWQVVLKDLGVHPADVLRRAHLPADLFSRRDAALSTEEYFRLWHALEDSFDDPAFPLRLGQTVSVEAFSPPIFAALCSPNLNIALQRLSHFERLIGPMRFEVVKTAEATSVTLDCLNRQTPLPASLIATKLVFNVHLARLATREQIKPLSVTATVPFLDADRYAKYFGVQPMQGKSNTLAFSAQDAGRPFLTANEKMWTFFEPELRRRLSEIDAEASFTERVGSALLELLPSGQSSIDAVARTLAVSRRTLQRRLGEEATSFQNELKKTREKLARHYLANSTLTAAEISFLLGFEDPNSFVRAFHHWTGTSPGQSRCS